MRKRRLSILAVVGMLATLLPLNAAPAGAVGPPVFINEIHYDNTGADAGEAIEIAGPAGTDLSGWTIALYNGSATQLNVYATINLAGTIPDLQAGFGTLSFAQAGIQNGSPDGLALVDAGSTVVEFLSYEGTFTAGSGPAAGMTSTDIGVSEPSSTPVGSSLQLVGTGSGGGDFTWAASQPNTFGAVNTGQTFVGAGDVPPTVVSVSPADGATGVAVDANITVNFSEPVTVSGSWFGISCVTSGAVTATASGGPASYTLDPDTDFANNEVCTVTLTAAQIADQDGTPDNLAADFVWSFTTVPSVAATTLISAVQGDGFVSPFDDLPVTIEGVVVGDFQQGDGFPSSIYDNDLDGYYVQEEDADSDGNPLTSEGIFVRDNANAVAVGDQVRVSGTANERFGLTRIENVTAVSVLASGVTLPTPATVTLPITDDLDFESVEGMSVILPQSLTISEYFNFDRFGEMVLTTDRAPQPTAIFAPGSPDAVALADLNARSRISLDDGRGASNPDPAIHPNGAVFDLTNRFRGGDLVTDLPGVMDYAFGLYRVQPTTGATYTEGNLRPPAPEPVGGDITVASFNVLNYFTTLDGSGPICGPLGDQFCRGADNAEEFTRQRDKIIDAITRIDADVVGLIEIENDPDDAALADLVAGLNDVAGDGTYDYIATGPVGPDVIRVALVYQPAQVTPRDAFAVLDTAEFLDPAATGEPRNRAALAQTFVDNANGGVFTAVVNHLKSKSGSELDDSGGICVDADPGNDIPDCDQGDGQAYFNNTRTLAAGILSSWLATDPTGSGDPDVLLIGDLNAYDKEDPIGVFTALGYNDLVLQYQGEFAYSYVFSGQWGYLDYIMANDPMASQVTGTTVWHINADEPDILDYDTTFKRDAQDALYEPNAFRSSDHDPVITGLELTVTPMQAKAHAIDTLSALLPTGDKQDDKRIEKAIESIEDSLNPDYWVDDFHLTDKGNKVFDEEKKAVKDLMKVDGAAQGDAAAVIDALVAADRELAATAIADAAAAGVDTTKAEEALAEGDAESKPDKAIDDYKKAWQEATKALGKVEVRFATFNASLNRSSEGALVAELSAPGSAQPDVIAEIIQRANPDVLLINEFDYDAGGLAAQLFQDNYLSVPHGDAVPVEYPYWYVAPSNTGVYSGFDLDNSGAAGDFRPNDSFGFGFFEGQFGMAVASKYPINWSEIRTFQNFLWKDMPGALLPDDPAFPGPADWYSPEELDVFRLSSKSHWDVPIVIGDETVHFLTSHPTPPVFDGPEDRNGTRNHDEIRFWADYVKGGGTASYIYDDNGNYGGLAGNALFVIAGDQNSDPNDGDSIPGAIQQLLDSPKVNTKVTPSSLGGPEQAVLQGDNNLTHLSDPAFDTADFGEAIFGGPGNLRVDYVLPRKNMKIKDAAVFWPESTDPLFALVGTFPFPSSDHRLVWIDVDL